MNTRRDVARYIDDGSEQLRSAVRASFADQGKQIELIIPRFVNPGRAAAARRIEALLKEYQKSFEAIVSARAARATVLEQRMDVFGLEVRQAVSGANQRCSRPYRAARRAAGG